MRPAWFGVGGPAPAVRALAIALLLPGLLIWAWSVYLILTRVPRQVLITTGPYALVKHPLYTAVGLLVFPAVGLLLNSWLGVVLGGIVYLAARRYERDEERALATRFGTSWDWYLRHVLLPWV